jgi:hypothetical protein
MGSNLVYCLDISYPHTKFGVNRLKQIEVIMWKLILHLGSNPKLPLDISYSHTKFGVNRPKQTQGKLKLLSGNWISIFSNSDLYLDHRHLGSNPKLIKVIEWKPKVDDHVTALWFLRYNNQFSYKNLVKNYQRGKNNGFSWATGQLLIFKIVFCKVQLFTFTFVKCICVLYKVRKYTIF